MLDLLVKNGRVIDTYRGIDNVMDIGVAGNKIVETSQGNQEAHEVIDASGCYVLPGLIDYHAHLYYRGTLSGTSPEFLPAMGVTFSVDAGSSGCLNFHAFYRSVIVNSSIRVKAFLSCYSMGLGGGRIVENFDPALFDEKRIAFVKDEYPDCILGLKMRLSHGLAADIRPLAAAVEMAERIGGMRVCVHVTNPPADMRDIASILRSGDILCHMYHGTGSTILDKDGRILPEVLKARERGVIFDVANGSKNCFHKVALAAIREGFLPDIISTDMTMDKTNSGMHVRSLPFAMSKFLSMGISLHDVVKATTEYPAMVLNMQGKVGTLAPGAFADISILRLTDREVSYVDTDGQTYAGKGLLVPQMTIANGVLAFGQVDFNLA